MEKQLICPRCGWTTDFSIKKRSIFDCPDCGEPGVEKEDKITDTSTGEITSFEDIEEGDHICYEGRHGVLSIGLVLRRSPECECLAYFPKDDLVKNATLTKEALGRTRRATDEEIEMFESVVSS